jgi:hypothetical protein
MKRIALALPLLGALSLPAPAQEAEDGSMMERGLRLFMDGLREEMEPALRDLGDLAQGAAPLLRDLQEELGRVIEDVDLYHAPEILPNGDILIRRREPLPEGDGAIDL